MRTALLPLLAVCALAVGLAACGDADDAQAPVAENPARATTSTTAAEPGSALERNAADANRLVGEGTDDLKARLASLKGHPVVVNVWASWCGPCRFEFPFFAAAVRKHGATVAFVGIDYMDSRDGAEGFLDIEPPGFPSIYDGDGKAARAVGGGRATPTTLFIGPDGKTRFTKLGGYATAADLDADIRRYALSEAS